MKKIYYFIGVGLLFSLLFFIVYDQNNKKSLSLHGTFVSQETQFNSITFNREDNSYTYYEFDLGKQTEYTGKFSFEEGNKYNFLDGPFKNSTIIVSEDSLVIETNGQDSIFIKISGTPTYINN